MNLSFAGCGFLGLYHMGVVSCLKNYAPQMFKNKVSGVSAGAIAACSLFVDLNEHIGEIASDILRVCIEARQAALGPFSPSFDPNRYFYESLNKILPDDIHLKANGRLHVSLTRVYDGRNLIVNKFSSKEELINVVLASTFVPIFTGLFPPRYRGTRVFDGGFSDNLPILDEQTITVSPFCGSADICPQDESLNNALTVTISSVPVELSFENLFRICNILLPPDAEVLSGYCNQGFRDALRFLQQRSMISCTRSLALESSYKLEEEMSEPPSTCAEYDPACADCVEHRQVASDSTVPESVKDVFAKAIEKMNIGYFNWVSNHRILKVVSYPATIVYRVFKLLMLTFSSLIVNTRVESLILTLTDPIFIFFLGAGYTSPARSHLARYSCEFNITQYGEDSLDDLNMYSDSEKRESVKEILNLGFVAQMENAITNLPLSQESALKFQNENFAKAISSSSRIHSRQVSLAPSAATSRRGSLIPSEIISTAVSRMESNGTSSVHHFEVVREVPDTIMNIKEVTDTKDPVLAYYYKDSSSEIRLMEIFDVTETDPSILLKDELENDSILDSSKLRSTLESSRFRQQSEPFQCSF